MQHVLHHACLKLCTSTLQLTSNQLYYIVLAADSPFVVCNIIVCVRIL